MKFININKQIIDTEVDQDFNESLIANNREEFEDGKYVELTSDLEAAINEDPEFDIINYVFPLPPEPVYTTYVSKHRIITVEDQLNPRNYTIGETAEDFEAGAYIMLSDEQKAWYEANPTATPDEVFNMAFDIDVEKERKIKDLMEYDSSDNVNSFTVNGLEAWLTVPERTNYNTSIAASEVLGHESVTFLIAGQVLTVPTTQAKQMLAAVQLYADACYMTTQLHKANIEGLNTVEAVNAYDFTAGYPEKLEFNIQ